MPLQKIQGTSCSYFCMIVLSPSARNSMERPEDSTYYLSADLGGIIINPIVGIILDSVGFQFMYLTMLIPVAIAAVVFTVIMATMGDRYARKSEISAS